MTYGGAGIDPAGFGAGKARRCRAGCDPSLALGAAHPPGLNEWLRGTLFMGRAAISAAHPDKWGAGFRQSGQSRGEERSSKQSRTRRSQSGILRI